MGTLARRRRLLEQLPAVGCDGRCAYHACGDLTVSTLDIVAMAHAGTTLDTAEPAPLSTTTVSAVLTRNDR